MADGTPDLVNLPHLDSAPSEAKLEEAKALIAAELKAHPPTGLHPEIQKRYNHEPRLSAMVQAAHNAIAQNQGNLVSSRAIDASRYEVPDPPEDASDTEAMKNSVKLAYVSSVYMDGRHENLQALEEHGKNSWLIENNSSEHELRGLESGLKKAKGKLNEIGEERRIGQEGVRGELAGLGERWRSSLGTAIEAEIGTEKLKKQSLEKRRKLAAGPAANS